jgi:hypothetical protein
MSWLTNGWIVGIGTSLVAGALISVISWFLLSKRERQEFVQRVMLANREVMYAIKPGIAEGHIPSGDILDAMAKATARKYDLDRKDLFTASELTDELIKEVMDSSFLSSAQKTEYCARLVPLRQTPVENAPPTKHSFVPDRAVEVVSLILGFFAAVVSVVFQKSGLLNALDGSLDKTQAQIVVSVLVFTLALLILTVYLWLNSRAKMRDAAERLTKISKVLNAEIHRGERLPKH